MAPTLRNTVVLLLASVVAGVGAVDSFISEEWDLLVVFLLTLVLHAVIWLSVRVGREPIPVRPDLADWLRRRSAATGEPMTAITDRAIASYRMGLTPVQDDSP